MSPIRKPADITRREFLKLSALAGGASLLAACGGGAGGVSKRI